MSLRSEARLTNTQIRRARVGGELTPGRLSMKLLKMILNAHIRLDPKVAPLITEGAWPEVEHRLIGLKQRIDTFLEAR